jgi:hypothetical protein
MRWRGGWTGAAGRQAVSVGELAAAEPLAPVPARATVTVTHRFGSPGLVITAASETVIARHRRAPDGAGAVVRDAGHVTALEKAVLTSFSAAPPCRRKQRRPPSVAAVAEAARLRGAPAPPSVWSSTWPPMPPQPPGCTIPPTQPKAN